MDDKAKIARRNEIKLKISKKIVLELLQGIKEHEHEFDKLEDVLDLIFDIMVIHNREVLLYIFKNFLKQNTRKDVMKNYFNVIKDEVNRNYKNPIPMSGTKQ